VKTLDPLKKGDLFLFVGSDNNTNFKPPVIGVVLDHWGRNSHNEKMYKIFANGAIEVISEIEIKKILSIMSKKKHY